MLVSSNDWNGWALAVGEPVLLKATSAASLTATATVVAAWPSAAVPAGSVAAPADVRACLGLDHSESAWARVTVRLEPLPRPLPVATTVSLAATDPAAQGQPSQAHLLALRHHIG